MDGAGLHNDLGVAAHAATGLVEGEGFLGFVFVAGATATTKDVAAEFPIAGRIVILVEHCRALVANFGGAFDEDVGVASDVAVAAAAVDVAMDLATLDGDVGVLDIAVVFVTVARDTTAGTIEVTFHFAAKHVDAGVLLDSSQLAAAKDGAVDVSVVTDGDEGPPVGGEVGGAGLLETAGGAVDARSVAGVDEGDATCGVVALGTGVGSRGRVVIGIAAAVEVDIRAYNAAADDDDGLGGIGLRNGVVREDEGPDGGQGAATVDTAVDETALDIDIGGAGDRSRGGTIVLNITSLVLANTGACAVYIAAGHPVDIVNHVASSPEVLVSGNTHEGIGRFWVDIGNAYLAAVDLDVGLNADVAILTAAIDGAEEAWPVGGGGVADDDVGVVDIAGEESRLVVIARRETRRDTGCRFTAAAAEDVAQWQVVLEAARGIFGIEFADNAASDSDVRVAGG